MSRLSHRPADLADAESFMRTMYLSLGVSREITERAIEAVKIKELLPPEPVRPPLTLGRKVRRK